MDIKEMERIIKELYPELTKVVTTWSNGTEYAGETTPACWHLYTYIEEEKNISWIETIIQPHALDGILRDGVEGVVRLLKAAFFNHVHYIEVQGVEGLEDIPEGSYVQTDTFLFHSKKGKEIKEG